METHKAKIERTESKTSLILNLGKAKFPIVLTEDKPNEIKEVFNNLLVELKKGEFQFELEDKEDDLYSHICKEYISQLNLDLASAYKELSDYGLLAT